MGVLQGPRQGARPVRDDDQVDVIRHEAEASYSKVVKPGELGQQIEID
jgi:hypothetical protein